MKYFKLPDLGEGLQEADIVQWHVDIGDSVKVDQLLVSVETAKAIVEIPSPYQGVIKQFFCQAGESLHINEPLVEFESELDADDKATVVGEIKMAEGDIGASHQFIIGSPDNSNTKTTPAMPHSASDNIKATPAIRALAKRLKVNLSHIKPTGPNQLISSADIEKAHQYQQRHGSPNSLKGVAKTMAKNMILANQEVAQVSLFDDVNISHWLKDEDLLIRLVQAIAYACTLEPKLNAKFDGERLSLQLLKTIDLGIAVDTAQGLFVPVLRDISQRPSHDLREGLQALRHDVENRSIPASELSGASFTLSNFGNLGGRYATPVVVPPSVAILGAGRARKEAVVIETPAGDEIQIQTILPLSLSFDHRPITGGEAARFLQAVKTALESVRKK